MKKDKLGILITILVAVTVCAIAFHVSRGLETRKVHSRMQSMRQWLNLNEEQSTAVFEADPDYEKETAGLSAAFVAERQQLGHLLTVADSSDSEITTQVESVIEANQKLVKRIFNHVLIVRTSLTPQQQQKFMNSCNGIIRGREAGNTMLILPDEQLDQEQSSQGNRFRRGHRGGNSGSRGGGNGHGSGNGHMHRHRGGLRGHIEFTPQQERLFKQLDPEFDSESTELVEQAGHEQEQLALLLESFAVSDEEILTQLEMTLDTRLQLEHRTLQYILRIRSHLSPEQQKQMVGLCSNRGNARMN